MLRSLRLLLLLLLDPVLSCYLEAIAYCVARAFRGSGGILGIGAVLREKHIGLQISPSRQHRRTHLPTSGGTGILEFGQKMTSDSHRSSTEDRRTVPGWMQQRPNEFGWYRGAVSSR
jgi:hypothetical protein